MYLIFFCLLWVTIEGVLLPSKGKCVIAPQPFLEKNVTLYETSYDVNPSCKRGIFNWQYPSHYILLHFRPHYKKFAVCFFNISGAHYLSFYDATNGLDQGVKLPPLPACIAIRPMCVVHTGGNLVVKLQTPKEQLYMSAFKFVVIKP